MGRWGAECRKGGRRLFGFGGGSTATVVTGWRGRRVVLREGGGREEEESGISENVDEFGFLLAVNDMT